MIKTFINIKGWVMSHLSTKVAEEKKVPTGNDPGLEIGNGTNTEVNGEEEILQIVIDINKVDEEDLHPLLLSQEEEGEMIDTVSEMTLLEK